MKARAAAIAVLALALASLAGACRKDAPAPAPPRRPRPIGVAFDRGAAALGGGGAAFEKNGDSRGFLRAAARSLEGSVAEDPEGRFGGRVELRGLESRVGGQDREQILRALAEGGCGLVVAMGPDYALAARAAAAAFPETRFAVVGAADPGPSAPAGIAYLGFAWEEPSFLAGVLAGLVAGDRPGAKVGFIGGMDSPEVRACDAGFCAGAAYANPSLRRPGMILRQYCGKGEDAFSDPAAAAAIASMQYRAGAEAIYHAAGASAAGIYEAARKAGKLVLASDAGRGSAPAEAADPILGFASRDAARAFLVLAREYIGTGSAAAGYRRLGLDAGAVSFEAGSFASARAAPRLQAVDAARAKLASGEIAAPRDELALAEFLRSLK